MLQTIQSSIQKNIRVTPEQWSHIEKSARERGISPNRLIVNLVMGALDRGDWPGNEAEIRTERRFEFLMFEGMMLYLLQSRCCATLFRR